jgi:putative transposase
MPYRRQQFVNDEIYHVVLRGIDENLVFKDINDYYRGIFSIYEFNTTRLITIRERREARARFKKSSKGLIPVVDKRDKLVEILTFCFMPNHIHLLLKQIKEGGISKFMQKLGAGYGGYLNKKYNRMGHVFQSRFGAIHIKNDEQLKTVFVYIHTNPVALVEPNWKEEEITKPEKVIEFLENYKWSSYPDYIGKKNFPSVTDRDFLLKIMEPKDWKKFVDYWIQYKGKIKKFPDLALE